MKQRKLSERLQIIAELCRGDGVVADIGTDHGYIPIWLRQNEACGGVILSDINAGPLEKARTHLAKFFPGEEFDLRQGPGISVLACGEADTVIIAGMGGILIREILAEDLEKTKSFSRLILQPRNYARLLRAWLRTVPWLRIEDEILAAEGRKLCEIIVVENISMPEQEPDAERGIGCRKRRRDRIEREETELAELRRRLALSEELELEVPLFYLTKGGAHVEDFLDRKIRSELQVVEQIRQNGTGEPAWERLKRSENRLHQLRKMEEYARLRKNSQEEAADGR